MSPPRVRFTARRLMVAVAVVAVAMGAVAVVGRRWAANERRAAGHIRDGTQAMRAYWAAYSEVSDCMARARSARTRQGRLEAAARDDPAGSRALRAAAERAAAEAERWDRAGVAPLRVVAESSRAARDAFGRAEDCRRRWW